MRNGRRSVLLLIVALCCIADPTAAPSQGLFTVEQLHEDFRQLRAALEENGPVIYQFTDKQTYDRLFDGRSAMLTRPMTIEEFRRIISPVVTRAGCLHTSLWMPQGYWANAGAKLLPLRPVFLNDTCYVWRAHDGAAAIREGSEITAIDGVPVPDILAVVKAGVSADGYNDSFRKFKMNEGFIFRYALEFGFRDSFEVTYRLPGEGRPRTATVAAVDLATAEEHSLGKNSTEGNALDYTFGLELLDDSTIAVITARSFAFYDHPETFNDFIDSAFAVIRSKGIDHLVLDIRNNNGGSPFCTVPLFSYLEPRPLPYFAEEYGRYSDFARPIPRAEHPYTGRLYTLINGNNISTAPHLCALLKYHKIGTLIGTETGGTYTCNAATHDLTLTNTKFIVTIATKSFAAAVEGFSKTRGIEPDVTVVSTIQDLLNRRDAQKEYALRLIRNAR